MDSALYFEQVALPLYSTVKKAGDNKYESMVYLFIGQIQYKKGNFKLAQDAFFKALQLAKERNNNSVFAEACLHLGRFYQHTGLKDSSLFYAGQSLEAFKDLKDAGGMIVTYDLISSVYQEQHKTDSSFAYLKLEKILADSLNAIQKKNLIAFQAINFNEQVRLQQSDKERTAHLNKIRTYSLLGGVAVLVFIGLLLYRNNKQKQKANIVLQQQKQKVETQVYEGSEFVVRLPG